MVSDLQLLKLLNSILFPFMEPNIVNSVEVIFLILKTTTKQNKTEKLPLGDVAQEEMKFHYVVQCGFYTSFVWKRIILQNRYDTETSFPEPEK